MRLKKEKSYAGYPVGTSFLPVMFVIICLIFLGALSLAGALRDKGYSDKTAEKTKAYYAAVSEAQRKLGEIDKAVAGIDGSYENDGRYLKDAEELVLSYRVPITDSQSLFVEVEVLDPRKGAGNIKIIRWQEVSENAWEEKGTLPVLQRNEERMP